MTKRNWFVPYLPVSFSEKVEAYVDGKDYSHALINALDKAENYVLLTGLHFMADYDLGRENRSARLADVLKKVANKAKVYLVVNQFWEDEGRMTQQAKQIWAVRSKLYSALMKQGELNGYLEETYNLFQELESIPNIICRTDIHPHPIFGTNHQKTVVIDDKIAFLGGIDLTYLDGDRWDTPQHKRTYRASNRTQQYWHDVHMSVTGDPVKIVRDNFRQRWEGGDLNTLDKKWSGIARGDPVHTIHTIPDKNPPSLPQWNKPNPRWYPAALKKWGLEAKFVESSDAAIVQIVRSMPAQNDWKILKPKWNLDTRNWERSAKDAYLVGISAAREYIYLENQWVADEHIWSALLEAAKTNKSNPRFRIILVVPYDGLEAARLGANQDGGFLLKAKIDKITEVIGDRFGMYSPVSWDQGLDELERPQIYVHSKIMIVDDVWALIGSTNAGGISLEGVRSGADKPDSELSAIVFNRSFATRLRQRLWSEHLETKVSSKYIASDADLFRKNASKRMRRIRFCPTYRESRHHPMLKATLNEIAALSRIETYGVDPFLPFSLSKLPRFRLVLNFPVPATNWGIYLMYRWVLQLGKIDSSGKFIGLKGKNYKLLKVSQEGTTFEFGFHTSTVVGQKTADEIQRWFVSQNRKDQKAQVSCRVRLVPFHNKTPDEGEADRDNFAEFVVSKEFLLLEDHFALANSPQ